MLATVYGDVHDIGKNLIKTILANNGYSVHDLGKQVPVNDIVDQAVDLQADVIGLSALLVSTSRQMPLVVRELDRRGLQIPVLVGGAAINRDFGRDISVVDERPYLPGRRALLPGRVRGARDGGPPREPGDARRTPRPRAARRRGAAPAAGGRPTRRRSCARRS